MSDSAVVKVTATIEVDIGHWGHGATFEGLREQSLREGKQRIINVLKDKHEFKLLSVDGVSVTLNAEVKK